MDKHGVNLDKFLIPSSRLYDRSIRRYLNAVIVYNLLKQRASDFDPEGAFDPEEFLRGKGSLSKYDAYALFQFQGMDNLITQQEVKHATKCLMITALLSENETHRDEARDLLIEKNIRAGQRAAHMCTYVTYSDIFSTDITSCKKLQEAGMGVDQIILCIQYALDHDVILDEERENWNLLFEFMGSSELSPEQLETGLYKIIHDRLRKPVAKRLQINSVEQVLSKKKKRASDCDTESSTSPKRRKFADISEEDSVHVPQLEGKAAAVMQRLVEVTGHAWPCTNGKMAYIAKTLAKKEAQAATKHQLYSSMSKDMLLYIAHALIPEERLSCSLTCEMHNVDRPITLHIF